MENNQSATMQRRVVVVIPCCKVTPHILEVISGIGDEVSKIYVVDDASADGSKLI